MLCLARSAQVVSCSRRLLFVIEGGRRITKEVPVAHSADLIGTLVTMEMPWEPTVIPHLESYFQPLLPPRGVKLLVNGRQVEHREPSHVVQATVLTELLEEAPGQGLDGS